MPGPLPLKALWLVLARPWSCTQLLMSCTNPKLREEANIMEHSAVSARPFTVAFIAASYLNVMRLNTIFISINLGGNHPSMDVLLKQSF